MGVKADQILAQPVGTKWMSSEDIERAPDFPGYIERTETGAQFVLEGQVVNVITDDLIPVVFTDESFYGSDIVVL